MNKVLEILKKILGWLQVIGELIARAIEGVEYLIKWLGGLLQPVAEGVRTIFGLKR